MGMSQAGLQKGTGAGSLLSLIGVAAVWGATFPLVHDGIVSVATLPFLQLRFLVAVAFLAPLVAIRARHTRWLHPRSIAPGIMLAAGFLLQTEGLRTTSPSVSAFLTGTSVVIVPLLGTLLGWEKGSLARWIAVTLAMGGIFLLQGARLPGRWTAGETATILCAVAFAGQILLVGRFAPGAGDPIPFAAGQIVVAALGLLVAGAFRGELLAFAPMTRAAWFAALFTGVLATAAAFLVQTWAQKGVSASVVAVCFATEPVFAALVSVLFYADKLGHVAWVGGALVTLATLAASIEPKGRIGRPSAPA
jgi:drug/metabolite transporter (DMT)-like permease